MYGGTLEGHDTDPANATPASELIFWCVHHSLLRSSGLTGLNRGSSCRENKLLKLSGRERFKSNVPFN